MQYGICPRKRGARPDDCDRGAGESEDINPCIHCLTCLTGLQMTDSRDGSVNPRTGRELRMDPA